MLNTIPTVTDKKSAIKFLKWYEDTAATYLYLAHFPTSRPFSIDYPTAGQLKTKAKIILGKHEFQNVYEQLKRVYPGLTIERYNKQREKLGIS
jgi:hypothetical protein